MPNKTFAQYIEDCAKKIRAARSRDYQGEKLEQVISMSLPFELTPVSAPKAPRLTSSHENRGSDLTRNPAYKKGILLTHGFLTSPYIMKSLAHTFTQAGFLVRAILLPGHGTSYQDLDQHTWQDWFARVRFGYESLLAECEEVSLCGFSIGATLSLLLALEEIQKPNTRLKKLILLAPCFGISPFALSFPFLVKTKLTRWLPELFCTQAEKEHLSSYKKFSLYSVSQIVLLLKTLTQALKPYQQQKIPLPIYLAASHEDSTVKFAPILNFINKYLNTDSYVRIYTNRPLILPKNIPNAIVQAQQLDPHILAISHVALPVAKEDPYLGFNGSYYGHLPNDTRFGEPRLYQKIKRLTYNPDYLALQKQLVYWLNENDYHLQSS